MITYFDFDENRDVGDSSINLFLDSFTIIETNG